METVIANTTIVTGDAGRTILYDSAIAIRDASIAAVGPTEQVLGSFPDAEVIDGRGKAVFPGLVNCHTHLLATADRGILEDFGFPTTLRFPLTTRSLLTAEERQVIAALGVLEAIRSGTTTILEIADNVGGFAQTLADSGMRLVLGDNINDVDPVKLRDGEYEFDSGRREGGLRRSAIAGDWATRFTCPRAGWKLRQ